MRSGHSRRAVTLYEIIIVLIVVAVLIAVLLPQMARSRCGGGRAAKDMSLLRGIHMSLVAFAESSDGKYPIPSEIDPAGLTLGIDPEDEDAMRSADVTRHIVSILLQNKSFTTYLTVSSAEIGEIETYDRYMYSEPGGAADPATALWDPSFRGTPRDAVFDSERETTGTGHFSFALVPAHGARQETHWTNNTESDKAIIGNRGPAYVASGSGADIDWKLVGDGASIADDFDRPVGARSNTLLIHGSKDSWEGAIAYNDNRVNYATDAASEEDLFEFTGLASGKRAQRDNLFVNEDDVTRRARSSTRIVGDGWDPVNNYLRSFSDRGTVVSDGKVTIGAFFD